MHILWTILIGLAVGLVARALKPGRDALGWIMTTLLGIGGALVAKLVGQQLGWYTMHEPAGFIASVAGAIGLLFLFNFLKKSA
jgi:uncharacterized membrane protein YeaQ/YmgE (transglycosylase-associated protein family)